MFSFYETDCDALQEWKQWASSTTFFVNNPRVNYSKTEQMNSNSLVSFWCFAFTFIQSHEQICFLYSPHKSLYKATEAGRATFSIFFCAL